MHELIKDLNRFNKIRPGADEIDEMTNKTPILSGILKKFTIIWSTFEIMLNTNINRTSAKEIDLIQFYFIYLFLHICVEREDTSLWMKCQLAKLLVYGCRTRDLGWKLVFAN